MAPPKPQPRVAFLPRYRGNPYLSQLESALTALGVRVEPYGRSGGSTVWGLLRRRPDVLHLQWLDAFFTARTAFGARLKYTAFKIMIRVLRRMGTTIVWTVHNLHDHERRNPELDRRCTQFVIGCADAMIVHGASGKQALIDRFEVPDAGRIHVIPHGHYLNVYENRINRDDARRELDLENHRFVFLFLGQIRPYKGVDELIAGFRQVAEGEAILLLAGKTKDEASARALESRVRDDQRIVYHPGFVPDQRIQVYMNACDVVVFPYRDILTSGGVVLAMSFGRACIAPRMGCIPDVLDECGAFLYDADEPDALPDALVRAIEHRAELEAMGTYNLNRAESLDWDRIGRLTLDVYRRCLEGDVS